MGREATLPKRIETEPEVQPVRNSYDSGEAHGLEHWIAIRQLVIAVRELVKEAD
jgi:hypothetical protein